MKTQNHLERFHLTNLTGGDTAPRSRFHAVKVYLAPDDYNDIIVKHLSDEDREMFKDCSWVPVELRLNTQGMDIEGVFVPVK